MREIACELGVAALEIHEHADSVPVDVPAHVAFALDDLEAAHGDVLAHLDDQVLAAFLERPAVRGDGHQRLDARGAVVEHGTGDAIRERAEVLVLRHEVGFGVHFDERVAPRLLVALEHDSAFGRDARSLLVGFRLTLLAEQLGRVVDVAAGIHECLLAVHHPRAGALAEFLDQCRFDLHAGLL